MQENEFLDPADREVADALSVLRPVGAGIAKDQMMFEAGLRAGRKRARLWQGISGVMALGVAAIALVRIESPGATGPTQVVVAPSGKSVVAPAAEMLTIKPAWRSAMERLVQLVTVTGLEQDQRPDQTYLTMTQAVVDQGAEILPAADRNPGRAKPERVLDIRPADIGGDAAFKALTKALGGQL